MPIVACFGCKKMFRVKPPRFVHIGMNKALSSSWVVHDHVFSTIFGSSATNH